MEELIKELTNEVRDLKQTLLNQTLTAKEAAEYLGYSYGHFMNYIIEEIPRVQRGRYLSFKKYDLEIWLKKNTK